MNHSPTYKKLFGIFLGVVFFATAMSWAGEEPGLSGQLKLEGGVRQEVTGPVKTYSYYRLFLQETDDLNSSLSFALAGEANWQTSIPVAQNSWPLYPQS